MRIMGLDVGAMTVGVAVSDELLCIAQGLEVIRRKQENKLRQTYARIEELALRYEVRLIVVGYPKNMNNTVGDRAQKCEAFAEDIKRRTGIPTLLWDERLTTVTAQRVLDLGQVSLEKKRAVVDKIAAAVILQNYLDYRANCGDGKETLNGENREELLNCEERKETLNGESREELLNCGERKETLNGENREEPLNCEVGTAE